MFLAFSCLRGGRHGLEENLGTLFTPRSVGVLQDFLDEKELLVVVDDLEPVRIWQWDTSQTEVTEWLELVRATSEILDQWQVKLWSEIESGGKINYDEVLQKIQEPKWALHVHRLFSHMKKFPNKKANFSSSGELREAVVRRAAHYALQGTVLEKLFPFATLLQTETPWSVKDPLFQPLRNKPLPIIHPFEERR